MPRIIKHPDIRRTEILEYAFELFVARGYENTSLNEVIAGAGLSKGAFYHHFSSKDELLAAISNRFGQAALAQVQNILNDPALDPLARLNAFMARSGDYKLEMGPAAWPLFVALFRPENEALYRRIVSAWKDLFRPILTDLITAGVAAKVFHTSDPEGVGEMLQDLASSTRPIAARALFATTSKERYEAAALLERRLRLHGVAIDRILGLPDGSIHLVDANFAKKFIRAMPPLARKPKSGTDASSTNSSGV